MNKKLVSVFAFLAINIASFSQSVEKIPQVKTGAVLKNISEQFKFTEGPAADKQGNVFFTDQPNDKIWKYDINGNLSVFKDNTGRSNGLYFDKNGNLLACADADNQLWSINKKGKVKILLDNFEGKKFNGPNDLWVSPEGHVYFTDPYYQRDYWTRKKGDLDKMNVYILKKGAKKAEIVDENLVQPNGIIGSADGKILYVADIKDKKTYKYQIEKDGSLSNRTLFVEMGSDGMTLDKQGNLYLTGKGVTIFDKNGEKIGNIPVPEGWTANVCFGGKDFKTLFITAMDSLYSLEMTVSGN
jgi:gluconolactonase